MKYFKLFPLYLLLLSCHPSQSASPALFPVAQWRFIDADTRKPIEGVWVNFAWNGKPTERGVSTCVRGVLARSDKDGWVRDRARASFWHLAPGPTIFKPGFQAFKYVMGERGEAHATFITEKIYQDRNVFGRYPAWEQNLSRLGFTWADHYWTRRTPRGDMKDTMRELNRPEFYMVPYRSFPPEIEQEFGFLGKQCLDDGAENIGLSHEKISETDRERAIASTSYLCRKEWDTLKPMTKDIQELTRRALWLIGDREEAWKTLETKQPQMFEHATVNLNMKFPTYTKEMRLSFCDWLEAKTGVDLYDK